MPDYSLEALIAAVIAGALAGSLVERWLLWRHLNDVHWVLRRLKWAKSNAEARKVAAAFVTTAYEVQLGSRWVAVWHFVTDWRKSVAVFALFLIIGGLALGLTR